MTGVCGLDAATLARLRADAEHARSPFVDPVVFRAAELILPWVSPAWLAHVVGRPVVSWRHLGNAGMSLAVAAAEADATHLHASAAELQAAQREAAAGVQQRAAGQAARERETWQELRARLPVPVDVWHNWTARHLDGYEQGADHITVTAALHAGRLHREPGQPLCWTPSRARQLRHVSPNTGDGNRLPDCKACLRIAAQLAAQPGNVSPLI